ncbi:SMP-30/gluconolactonase/LRE family protein [Variovorax ureilyticus]|uniref:SMP-30/gluconolactonase/LRE family protein n=1 Tax=Variovorax ureilyticus TaxID=1836198 RepID=A0ABU8VNN9_9BURK
MAYTIDCVMQCANHLGEGPVWDADHGLLYWLDCTGQRVGKPTVWRFDPRTGATRNWSLQLDVGAMALRTRGGAVLAASDGFYFLDLESGEIQPVKRIDTHGGRVRLNDGKCDRRGRFFAGGMDDEEELAVCSLYRLDPDLNVVEVDRGIICSNGPCWSPDDRTFYFADSFKQELYRYDYDIESGSLSNKQPFASTSADTGLADGSTVDAEGCIWNAQVISGDLVRYTPDGKVERRIGMPVRNVTSVMFGGDDLDEIYVTSMGRVTHPKTHEHFAAESKPQFGAGALFRIKGLGIRGLPEPKFAG